MVINVPLNSSVAANLIFASRFILNINYHQCPLIFSLILASRRVFKIHLFLHDFIGFLTSTRGTIK